MIHQILVLAMILLSVVYSAGCSTSISRPQPTLNTKESIAALDANFDLAGNIARYNATGATESAKRTARDNIIDSGIALIDARYDIFVNDFTQTRKEVDTLSEVGAIGINTAGALTTPASTVRILSGIAGGITASNTSFNKNFFYEKSLVVLIRQMDASRREALVLLLKGRMQDTGRFTLADALAELGRYYHAGTFEGSFEAIMDGAAATEVRADQKIRDIRGVTISWKTWIERNGRDQAIDLILNEFNALPAVSQIRSEILATATGVVIHQFPPTVALGAADANAAHNNVQTLSSIFGTAVVANFSFNANPGQFPAYLRGHGDPDALAEILGTKSLGLLPPN